MKWFSIGCPFRDKFKKLSQRQKETIDKLKADNAVKEEFIRNTKAVLDVKINELRAAYALMAEQEDFKNATINLAPMWFWVKEIVEDEEGTLVSGKYLDVNDKFRKEFMCDFPKDEIVGYTDAQMAAKIKYKYGEDSFTFGQELCADSDNVVIREGKSHTTTFTENGKIKGEMRYVIVHKKVFYVKGKPVATLGAGRDITTDYRQLEEIMTFTSDEGTKEALRQYLDKNNFVPNKSVEKKGC